MVVLLLNGTQYARPKMAVRKKIRQWAVRKGGGGVTLIYTVFWVVVVTDAEWAKARVRR